MLHWSDNWIFINALMLYCDEMKRNKILLNCLQILTVFLFWFLLCSSTSIHTLHLLIAVLPAVMCLKDCLQSLVFSLIISRHDALPLHQCLILLLSAVILIILLNLTDENLYIVNEGADKIPEDWFPILDMNIFCHALKKRFAQYIGSLPTYKMQKKYIEIPQFLHCHKKQSAQGLISQSTKIHLKMSCQDYRSDLNCDIKLCFAIQD